MSTRSSTPPPKRAKVESSSLVVSSKGVDVNVDQNENQCSICLQEIVDRTVVPTCSHDFCFECLVIWTRQSRRCPLCAQTIGEYLIHNIRSKHDFSKHYLAPLRISPTPLGVPLEIAPQTRLARRRRTARERELERRTREELDEADRLERSIMKRRWIYHHHLYAKHVASNTFTRYKPYPSPAQFSASQDWISRATCFIRRELQVWPNLDIEVMSPILDDSYYSIEGDYLVSHHIHNINHEIH
ncbi:hypothetical protein AMATHDRAFT_137517 [Amanita thiersii Skay4041]|uniref:RING-type E3 ubiquitin transferase n=1 Tax=Amanita thiersii Skay4041 TaxID=703135 RepID=A0A2A9NYM3_9AGAR|nr:hypothetical protein AMATHDRAFT_137517 [Amanita thiersii Skay4041]